MVGPLATGEESPVDVLKLPEDRIRYAGEIRRCGRSHEGTDLLNRVRYQSGVADNRRVHAAGPSMAAPEAITGPRRLWVAFKPIESNSP